MNGTTSAGTPRAEQAPASVGNEMAAPVIACESSELTETVVAFPSSTLRRVAPAGLSLGANLQQSNQNP